jgi:DNA polymerase-1
MSRLLLIDSHAILHRTYHALPKANFKSQGQLVNAVYGFFSMFLKAVDQLEPDYLITGFDAPGPTFRHEKFIGYQAHRPEVEDELKDQMKITRKSLKKADIPVLMKQGYEADDIIGTICKKVKEREYPEEVEIDEIIVVTGDKDLMQLVDNQVKLFMLTNGISGSDIVGSKEVEEKLGIKPNQVVDYKALIGDSSDNYPGVYGIGPKTAEKLFDKFDSLAEIYDNLDQIKGNKKKKLEKGKESAFLSQELAIIVQNAPIDVPWDKVKWSDQRLLALKQSLKELNFRSLVGRIEDKFNKGDTENQMSLI